jgi:DNA-binding SARP family transcriptional activator/tetratricopeptide (TPR) repeat protein
MSEFRLLGPVEVWAGGRRVDAGHRQQVSVLAALLVDCGHPVQVDTLIDRVWGATPPRGARQSLHAHVTRIRQVLRQAGEGDPEPVRLSLQSGCYLLDVDQSRVDIHRFLHLAAQARRPQHSAPQRVTLLREAVSLWHGEPLAGLRGDWVQRCRDTWHQQHVDVTVAWAHAELQVANPDPVIAPLHELATTHALNEPVAAVLMRAMSAAGRPAAALERYDTVRRHLIAELGTDPSTELQQVYQAILQGEHLDPTTTPPTDPTPAPTTPAQLPGDVPGFAGRHEHLSRLDTLIGADPSDDARPAAVVISAVSGTAGVGKTALAVHWAHTVAHRFPDGQLYVNLRGFDPSGQVMDPAEAIRGFLDALGVPPERIPHGLDAQAGLYRSLTADKHLLILLDNARDVEQTRPLLPATGTCLAVVTSRNPLTGLVAAHGAYPLMLDVLPDDEAREVLTLRIGAERVHADPAATGHIITACARLPLALAIAAARAQQTRFPLTVLAAELRDAGQRLDALDAGDPTSQIRAVFSWSYTTLTEPAARLFRLLGLHPGPDIDTTAAANLIDHTIPQTRQLLAELVRTSLLTEYVPGRYTFHDLLRAYATELAFTIDSEQDRHAALRRLLDYYLGTAHAAALALQHSMVGLVVPPGTLLRNRAEEFTGHDAALAWLVTERPSLIAAVSRARDAGYFAHCWQLARVLQDFLAFQGHWHDLHEAQQVALDAAERAEHLAAQAEAHRALAYANTLLGQYQQAEDNLQRALDRNRDLGDPVFEGTCRHCLSIVYSAQGRRRETLENERRALEIFQRAGDQRGEAIALNTIAGELNSIGEYEQALGHSQQALTLQRRTEGWQREWYFLDNIAYAHYRLGQYRLAQDYFRRAADLCQQIGCRPEQVVILTRLGDAHHAAEEPEPARTAWQQALTIAETLDHLTPGMHASGTDEQPSDIERLRAKLQQLN